MNTTVDTARYLHYQRMAGRLKELGRKWEGLQQAFDLYPAIRSDLIDLLVQGDMSDEAILHTALQCALEESVK